MAGKKVPMIVLSNSLKMPGFGLGTWQSSPGEVGAAVKTALELGYRHIDCAMIYNNEKEVGSALNEAIKANTVKRQDLFITTKLWNTFHEKEVVVDNCKKSLEKLKLDYVDLYLIHWPFAQKMTKSFDIKNPFHPAEGFDYDYVKTWQGMEECVDKKLTKSIGISNFNAKQIERILKSCKIKPVTNQIEVNIFNNEKKMIEFCKTKNIIVTAYSPLTSPGNAGGKKGDPKLDWKNDKLTKIAKKYNKTVGQVLLRYVVQLGTVPIPKSVNKSRLKENIEIFDFKLRPEDMTIIDSFNVNFRGIRLTEMQKVPHYPFNDWI